MDSQLSQSIQHTRPVDTTAVELLSENKQATRNIRQYKTTTCSLHALHVSTYLFFVSSRNNILRGYVDSASANSIKKLKPIDF